MPVSGCPQALLLSVITSLFPVPSDLPVSMSVSRPQAHKLILAQPGRMIETGTCSFPSQGVGMLKSEPS